MHPITPRMPRGQTSARTHLVFSHQIQHSHPSRPRFNHFSLQPNHVQPGCARLGPQQQLTGAVHMIRPACAAPEVYPTPTTRLVSSNGLHTHARASVSPVACTPAARALRQQKTKPATCNFAHALARSLSPVSCAPGARVWQPVCAVGAVDVLRRHTQSASFGFGTLDI